LKIILIRWSKLEHLIKKIALNMANLSLDKSRLFPRCPYCPAFIIVRDVYGKEYKETVHAASQLKILESTHVGDSIPEEFDLDGITHFHDFAKVIITWQCGDGHVFSTTKNKIDDCIGCIIAEQKARQKNNSKNTNNASIQRTVDKSVWI
jgi:hypothetical protein